MLVMYEIDIPGFRRLELKHLVLDFNGTLAVDGRCLPGVAEALRSLSGTLRIHILTADTFGRGSEELAGLPIELSKIPGPAQAEAKLAFVERLDPEHLVAIGNGRNDRAMLERAALSIAVMQAEGVAGEAVSAADIVVSNVLDALQLLRQPLRLTATLRS